MLIIILYINLSCIKSCLVDAMRKYLHNTYISLVQMSSYESYPLFKTIEILFENEFMTFIYLMYDFLKITMDIVVILVIPNKINIALDNSMFRDYKFRECDTLRYGNDNHNFFTGELNLPMLG